MGLINGTSKYVRPAEELAREALTGPQVTRRDFVSEGRAAARRAMTPLPAAPSAPSGFIRGADGKLQSIFSVFMRVPRSAANGTPPRPSLGSVLGGLTGRR